MPVCAPASGGTFKPGTTTVSCTATDAAGNSSTQSFNVTVSFTRGGFYQPIDMGSVINQARRGPVVPVKFEVFGANGVEMIDVAVAESITVQPSTARGTTSPVDLIEQYLSSTAPLRYDTASGQLILNWRTSNTPGCYSLSVMTTDKGSLSAIFRVK